MIIENDSSEFCGVWIADHAEINTKKMTVTGTKQTVDIESEMSGYSVSFGNVFNPFVTGAVASALPNVQVFDSEGKQHLERRTASVLNFKDANIKTVDLELHHGIINADNLNLEVERNLVIEHLKETNTSWHNSHSFGINFGAMMSFGMNPAVGSGMMAAPVVRNEKGYSIEENLSKSGIYAREKTVKIGKVIEITPTLRNEEKISVQDTAPISSIGSIMAGVQEIKENWEEIHEPHHDIIIDAEPVENDVITEASKEEKKTVIATDADPGVPDAQAVKEPDYTINEAETRALLDEIYDEDIAPYREFERVQSPTFSRPGSPVSDLDYFGIAQNFVKAVVESAVEFGAELVTPGGVENYQKFKAGKISALEYTNLVAQDMAKDATAAAIGAQIGGGLGGTAGFAMAGGGSIPGAAAGSTAGAVIGTAISRAGTAISRTLNKEKHESTVLMNENHSKSACGGKTEKVSQQLLESPKMVKHHLFNKFRGKSEKSQKYRDFFKKHNINVDDHCVLITERKHKEEIHVFQKNWTTRWKRYIDENPNASTKEVYQFAGQLMDEYGIAHLPIIKY